MTTQQTNVLIPLITVTVALLGFGNWAMEPEKAVYWLMPILFVPVAWGVMRLLFLGKTQDLARSKGWHSISNALFGAGLILAGSLALSLGTSLGLFEISLAERGAGLIAGMILVVVGNAAPKQLSPLKNGTCAPSRAQKMQRFAGWVFVIAGLVYSSAWAFLPINLAQIVSISAGILSIFIVLLRLITMPAQRD